MIHNDRTTDNFDPTVDLHHFVNENSSSTTLGAKNWIVNFCSDVERLMESLSSATRTAKPFYQELLRSSSQIVGYPAIFGHLHTMKIHFKPHYGASSE